MITKYKLFEQYELDDPFGEEFGFKDMTINMSNIYTEYGEHPIKLKEHVEKIIMGKKFDIFDKKNNAIYDKNLIGVGVLYRVDGISKIAIQCADGKIINIFPFDILIIKN